MKTSTVLGYSLAMMLCIVQRQGVGRIRICNNRKFLIVGALQCYECNSHDDSRCAGEKLPDALKKDCATLEKGTAYTMCRKITQVIEFEVNGMPPDSRVIRGCGWDESNYKGKCYQRSGFGGRQEVCSCTEDYCNSAPKSVPSLAGLGLLLVVVHAVFSLKSC